MNRTTCQLAARIGPALLILSLGAVSALDAQKTTPAQVHLVLYGTVDVSKLPPPTKAGKKHTVHHRHHADDGAFEREKAKANAAALVGSGPAMAPPAASSISIGPGGEFFGMSLADSSLGAVPPDTQVAAGAGFVVEAVNTDLRIWNRNVNPPTVTDKDLISFFGLFSSDIVSDPRIRFDTVQQRWYISCVSVEQTFGNQGDFRLAVSTGPDPTQGFTLYSVSTTGAFPDYPHLGFNDDKLVLTANSYGLPAAPNSPFIGTEFIVVNKSDLVNHATSPRDTFFPAPQGLDTIQPGVALSSACNGNNCPMFMAAIPDASISTANKIRVWTLQGVPGVGGGVKVQTNDLSIPALTIPPNAVQQGSGNLINLDDARLLDAVWANNSLWVTSHTGCTPSGDTGTRACLHFAQINTGTMSLSQDFVFGQLGGYEYYPAIQVDKSNNLIAVFNQSSIFEYPSVYAGTQPSGSAPGTFENPILIFEGQFPLTPSSTDFNRWGDYSGAHIDPSGTSVWVAAEIVNSADADDWGTVIAQVYFNTAAPIPTTSAVASSANPSTDGQSVTFTATVTPTSGAGTPTGIVTFKDGSTELGIGTLNAGRTSITTSALSGGLHSITAIYGGDGSFSGSTSTAINQIVNQAPTTTSLSSAPNPSTSGTAVTLVATVTSISGTGLTGSVTFNDGAVQLGTGAVNSNGIATLTTSSLSVGAHTITAVYGGDTNFASSTSPSIRQTVNSLNPPTSENGYSFERAITIDHTKVPIGDQSNFPVLVSGTYSYLATVANGGNVQRTDVNGNALDLIFTADSGCSSKLNFEIESYVGATGQIVYWVQVPGLSHSSDTVIYMCYSNSSVTASQASGSPTWDSNYKGVWHLPNGISLSVGDSTTNALSATINGATAVAGQMGGGAGFSGSSSSNIAVASSTALDSTTGTWSGWFKTSQSIAGVYPLLWARASGSGSFSGITLFLEASSGHARVQMYGSGSPTVLDITGGTAALNDGNWHYLVFTFNATSAATLYVDGAAVATGTPTQSWSFNGQVLRFAAALDSFWKPLSGSEDEFRVSNIVRSASWTATEFNNQNSPATFYGVGPAVTPNGPVTATPTFSPAAGNYSSAQSVTISTTTAGASIRYTTDGSTPTSSTGTVYSGPIAVNSSLTLKAIAYESGFADSAVASAAYTINTSGWYNTSWTNRKSITIDHTKVSGGSALSSFPLLFSVTDPNLRSIANGGSVGKADGTDILFTAADGVTKLNHEIETYSAATGQLQAWVQLPSLSPTTDTVIDIYYGNPSAPDQQNKTGVWDANYKGVWHLPDGTNLSVNDSTSNVLSATINGATAVAGQMGGGAGFSGSSSSNIAVASSTALDSTTGTWSGWFKTSQSIAGVYPLLWARASGSGSFSGITLFLEASSGHARVQMYGSGSPTVLDITGGTAALNDGNWHYLVFTFNATSAATLYVDGAAVATGTPTQSWSFNGQVLRFAAALDSFWKPLSGSEDEFRVSNIVRSASWTATEFNNQNSPATFYGVGPAVTPNGPVTATPTFSPAAGNYSSAQSVTISTTTAGASIRYTTDGSTPTSSTGTVYSGPIAVNSSLTLKAIAYESGFADSAVASAAYTINTSGWYNTSWTNRKSITIDHTKVSGGSALSSFPLLFSVTDPNLRSIANGGSVGKADGTDILFTAADGVTKLNHEIETYSAATGQLQAWVQLPSLSPTTDTVIDIYYGNPSAPDQQNKTGVWDANYKGVWHLPDGTNLSVNDSTSNVLSATINGATAVAGQMGGGAGFSGSSSSNIAVASSTALDSTTGTWSGWFKTSQSIAGVYPLLWARASGSGSFSGITLFLEASSGHARVQMYGSGSPTVLDITGGTAALNDGNWHYLVFTFNATSAATLYVDGAAVATGTPTQSWSFNGQVLRFAAALDSFWKPLSGSEDEFRVSNIVRSASWTATEFNNQNSPATFYGVGPAVTPNGPVTATPTFSPAAGNYSSAQSVTISTTTAGASIRYTTDGSTPTSSTGTVYSGPIAVNSSLTLKAIAYESGFADSAVASAAYTINTSGWYNTSWTNRKSITIDHTKVSGGSALSSFPLLFSVTDPNLRSIANGGSVGKADGTDILFTAADGVTKLNHEIETYSAATGQLQAWVQLPSLSPTTDTVIDIYYGNPSAPDQQNKTGVWDANYKGVWHLPDGTNLSVNDSTSNVLSATINGATAVAGQMGGGAGFSGSSSSNIAVASSTALDSTTGTWSGWFKTSQSIAGVYPLLWARASGSGSFSGITLFLEASSGHARVQMYGSGSPTVLDITGGTAALNDGNWHYLVFTFNATSAATLYVDGAAVATGTPTQSWSFNGQVLRFAAALDSFWKPLSGSEDEFRVSNIVRSASWTATEFNNQNSPATFYRVSQ